jgi:hypothetical protein
VVGTGKQKCVKMLCKMKAKTMMGLKMRMAEKAARENISLKHASNIMYSAYSKKERSTSTKWISISECKAHELCKALVSLLQRQTTSVMEDEVKVMIAVTHLEKDIQ